MKDLNFGMPYAGDICPPTFHRAGAMRAASKAALYRAMISVLVSAALS